MTDKTEKERQKEWQQDQKMQSKCPYCGSTDTDLIGEDEDYMDTIYEHECNDCQETYYARYKRVFIKFDDEYDAELED